MERRLVADVPAGTCLSGGIDSSSIVKVSNRLLAEHVPDAVSLGDHLKTFSIVYDGDPIDEREYMDAVLAEVDAEPAFAEPTSERVPRASSTASCGTRTSPSCRPGRTRSGA